MKKFFVLWSSQAASMFGSAVVGFALAWYLARETGSATILSTAMLVNFLPQIVLGPLIGPFIDRWDRKKIMVYSDVSTALLTLVLVVLFYTDTAQVWHIYVIMFARAAGGAFQFPAFRAAFPMIVPEKHLARANGLFMSLRGSINIVGPLAGAFLMETLDMQWVLSVDIITAVIAVGCLLPLAIPNPEKAPQAVKPGYLSELKGGFRYIFSWRGLMFLVVLAVMINFFAAPVNALLPLFVTEHYGGDVLKLGWLESALGIGIIAGGLILGAWGGFKRRILTCLTGMMVWSFAIFIFGFTSDRFFYPALGVLLVCGLFNAMMNAPAGAIFQSVVAKDMQGRFHSIYGSLITMMVPVALLIAGPAADAIGLRTVWWVSGGVMFVAAGVAFFSRELRNIEERKAEENPFEETPAFVPKLEDEG